MSGFEPVKEKPGKGAEKNFMEAYREQRLFADDTTLISDSAYNITIGLTIALGFAIDFFMAYFLKAQILQLPIIGVIIAYFIMSLGGIFVVHKSTSAFVSGLGFIVLAAGMGLLLTFILNEYNLSSVYLAFGITVVITVVITMCGTIFKDFFLSMGRVLMIALIVTIIAELACTFLLPGALGIFDYAVILLFAGYIGFDWARAQQFPKTMNNAIDSAADLYIDIVNILIRVLEIVGKKD